jgi:RNA polymerase sigma-70 factor (ECF subfamily)
MVEREHNPSVGSTADQGTPLSVLERARRRDPEAWRRLVDLYQPLVRFWCQRGGVRSADVEDVTQEVLAATAAGLDQFHRDQPGDTFRGWLRGIARKQIALHFRHNQGRPQAEGGSDAWRQLQNLSDPLAEPDADEVAETSRVYHRALEQVRRDFEERTWQAFWRTAIEGQTPGELTRQLSMTPAAIRQAKARVLRRLKQEMGELLA